MRGSEKYYQIAHVRNVFLNCPCSFQKIKIVPLQVANYIKIKLDIRSVRLGPARESAAFPLKRNTWIITVNCDLRTEPFIHLQYTVHYRVILHLGPATTFSLPKPCSSNRILARVAMLVFERFPTNFGSSFSFSIS